MTEVPTVQVAGVPDPIPDGVVVLDVREPDEYAAGHLADSQHIPLSELPSRLGEVVSASAGGDKSQVLVVCRVGSRSQYAAAFLQQQGVDAVNLAGGLVAWDRAGRALESDAGDPFVL